MHCNVYNPGADDYYVHMMRSHPDFIPELAFVLKKDGEIVGNLPAQGKEMDAQPGRILYL